MRSKAQARRAALSDGLGEGDDSGGDAYDAPEHSGGAVEGCGLGEGLLEVRDAGAQLAAVRVEKTREVLELAVLEACDQGIEVGPGALKIHLPFVVVAERIEDLVGRMEQSGGDSVMREEDRAINQLAAELEAVTSRRSPKPCIAR